MQSFFDEFEIADYYQGLPQKRCDCGNPIARTSSLHCCHLCNERHRRAQLREMTTGAGGRMDRYIDYRKRR